MDYPHGHVGHHRHHNRRDDDEEDNNTYPPPPFSHSPFPPPPPPFSHSPFPPPPPPHQTYPPPPPPHVESQFCPPPPQPSYPHQSSSHQGGGPNHHSVQPHMPTSIGSHHHGGPELGHLANNPPPPHAESQFYPPPPQPSYAHQSSAHEGSRPTHHGGPDLGHLENKPSHKIHCKAGGDRFAFGIRDGKVVLTHPDSSDLTQHWYKDEKYSTKVKDKDGHPSFMLVNKGTGQAVKHSISCHPVQLAPYKPDVLDESVLWTESKDLGSGFRTIRTVNNIRLVMDAWNADKDHGGIHDGTVIALYETWKGDNQNQQWKFVRH